MKNNNMFLRLNLGMFLAALMTWAAPASASGTESDVAARNERLVSDHSVGPREPTKVTLGIYVTSLYDIDMPRKSFNATFWAWYLHEDANYVPTETVEIVNAKTTTVKYVSTVPSGNLRWDEGKYFVTIVKDWDITRFPFDRHVLEIPFEDSAGNATAVAFVPDTANSRLDKSVSIPGWTIESFDIKTADRTYDTTYGDPALQGQSTYSRIVAEIVVKREGWRLLTSMFIGFFVAFGMVFIAYFLNPENLLTSRVAINTSAAIVAVGNKYIVDFYLPPASSFTLADAIEVSTFLAIILGLAMVVVVNAFRKDYPALVERLDRVVPLGSLVVYLSFIGWEVAGAVG